MVSVAARIGTLLGCSCRMLAAARGEPSVWVAAGLAASALALLMIVLFIPSETPARRLRQLIQAWKGPVQAGASQEPCRLSAPPAQARNDTQRLRGPALARRGPRLASGNDGHVLDQADQESAA
jgi:hypothetical protein